MLARIHKIKTRTIMANKLIDGVIIGLLVLMGCMLIYVFILGFYEKPSSFTATATCEYITNKNTIVFYGCIGNQNILAKSNAYNPNNIEHCIYNYVDEQHELHQCVLSNMLDIDVDDDESVQFTPHCVLGSTKTVYPDESNKCDFEIPQNHVTHILHVLQLIVSVIGIVFIIVIFCPEWKQRANNEPIFMPVATNTV